MKRLIDEDQSIRLDRYLATTLGYSRSKIKSLFDNHHVHINGIEVKPPYLLKEGDFLEVKLEFIENELKPENLNIPVVYEDKAIIVLDKPRGLLIHPALSSNEVSLVSHLLFLNIPLSHIGGEERPGIIHRLDKDTSGLVVVAKSDAVHLKLSEAFKNREVVKVYHALTHHPFSEDEATINAPITRDPSHIKMMVDPKGKEAITHLKVLRQNNTYSYLEINIPTGRTHQIRVHLSYINHPVVGDLVYGSKKTYGGQLLHAKTLGLNHPVSGDYMEFESPLPMYFKEALERLL